MSILRTCLGISFLMSVVMLMGCGQGLSGQAIGGDDENIEVLKQQIADISDRLADLDANIEAVESDQGIDDIRDVREGIQGNSDSLANLKEIIENVEETIDVINSSVVDLASLVENADQAKAIQLRTGDPITITGKLTGWETMWSTSATLQECQFTSAGTQASTTEAAKESDPTGCLL